MAVNSSTIGDISMRYPTNVLARSMMLDVGHGHGHGMVFCRLSKKREAGRVVGRGVGFLFRGKAPLLFLSHKSEKNDEMLTST